MYCNKCAVKVNEEDMFCFHCGTRLKEEKVVSSRVEEVSKTNKNVCYDVFAIVGLIMGILGIVLAMFSAYVTETLTFAGNELIISIGGIIFGALGIKSCNHKGKSITGLVLGSVSTLINLLLLISLYF